MGPIDLLDDFLEPDLYEELMLAVDKTPMYYGSRSNPEIDMFGHWAVSISGTSRFNKSDCVDNLRAPFDRVWSSVREVIENKVLMTSYMNGHTYGTEGYFHRDSDEDNCTTAILYLVRGEWKPNWGGETIFIDDHNQIQAAIFPRANRLITFPSSINHCARGVTRMFPGVRKTLMFKTRRDSE